MKQNTKFNWSVIGHRNIICFLESCILNNKVAHAYLFCGPAHVGKTTVASKFVSSLLGRDEKSLNIHSDVYWIKREKKEKSNEFQKNITIKQIRELERKLSLSSFLNSYKIAIIEEAETLSQEACDSLLKTLEEPKDKTVIILITKNINSLPSTIWSRCQILKFSLIPQSEIFEFLLSRKVERIMARDLSHLALGRPGLIFEFLGDLENNSSSILKNYQEKFDALVDFINSPSLLQKFKIIERFAPKTSGVDITERKEILNIWILILRDLLLIKNNCESLISHNIFKEKIKIVAPKISAEKIINFIKEIRKIQDYISLNVNFRLVLENLILNF